jgi:hypothetical protein
MIDDDDCGTVSGMTTGREDPSIQRKPVPVPLHYKSHMTIPGLKPKPARWEDLGTRWKGVVSFTPLPLY